MTAKPTILLILYVTTAAFPASAPIDPNDTPAELSFRMSTDPTYWEAQVLVDGSSIIYQDPGSIRPRYVAQVTLPRRRKDDAVHTVMKKVMESPLAQEFSQAQKDFLAEGFAVRFNTGTHNPHYYTTYLYAVSERDARIMVRALLDGFATEGRERLARDIQSWDAYQQDYERMQRELIEKQKRLNEIEPRYEQHKEEIHPGLSDDDAQQLARELILQMGKEGNMLAVELAGIRAKLKTIGEYLSGSQPSKYLLSPQRRMELEAKHVDQMIELGSLEARKEAIQKILAAEQEFCSLYREHRTLRQTIPGLRGNVEKHREGIKDIPKEIKRRREAFTAPEVYQNTVTIYPIPDPNLEN